MTPIVYHTGHIYSETVGRAFFIGAGTEMRHAQDWKLRRDEIPCFYGILRGTGKIVKDCWANEHPFVYIDHGYFGAGHFDGKYRVVVSDLHTDCRQDASPAIPAIQDWRENLSGPILVAPPSLHVTEFFGIDRPKWIKQNVTALKKRFDNPIKVLEKDGSKTPLEGARAVASLQSNLMVDAIIAGIPVVHLRNPEITHPISVLKYHDRADWLGRLAACQFTLREMIAGKACKFIQENTCSIR